MKAKAGDPITDEARERLGRACGMPGPWPDSKVATKTDGTAGQWVCVTCGESFHNNMQANGHYEDMPKHLLAWLSSASQNIEEP